MEDRDRILDNGSVSDLFSPKYRVSPRRGKRADQRFAELSAPLGKRLHLASGIAMRGDAAHVVSLRKANENVRDGMKTERVTRRPGPTRTTRNSTRTNIKKAGPGACRCACMSRAAIDAEAQRFRNRDLDHAPITDEIGIAVRQGPQTVRLVGRDDPGIVRNGARARTRRTASRNVDLCHQRIRRRSNKFTVNKKVPPATRLGDNSA